MLTILDVESLVASYDSQVGRGALHGKDIYSSNHAPSLSGFILHVFITHSSTHVNVFLEAWNVDSHMATLVDQFENSTEL